MALPRDNDTAAADSRPTEARPVKLRIAGVSFWYGETQVLFNVSLDIGAGEVTALIGHSGSGKSTLLHCLDRSNEDTQETRLEGLIALDGLDIHDKQVDPVQLRRSFGWVAEEPNPFPRSIYDNIVYGPRIRGLLRGRGDADEVVQRCLEQVGMWPEVRDRLDQSATLLSRGQQQRLCIARALATKPQVLLMDKPCSVLDPIATAHIEKLIEDLRGRYTIVIIPHNLHQAARVSQYTAFFHQGRLREVGDTEQVFTAPRDELCHALVTGRIG